MTPVPGKQVSRARSIEFRITDPDYVTASYTKVGLTWLYANVGKWRVQEMNNKQIHHNCTVDYGKFIIGGSVGRAHKNTGRNSRVGSQSMPR